MNTLNIIFGAILNALYNVYSFLKIKVVYRSILIVTLVWSVDLFFTYYDLISPVTFQFRNPVVRREIKVVEKQVLSPIVEVELEPAEVKEPVKSFTGMASYYSSAENGCYGCTKYYDENGLYYIMANGERLDDSKKTIALGAATIKREGIALNTEIVVTNTENGKSDTVKLTDTGSFDVGYGRVADLSLALRDSLECGDLCKVKIEIF